MQNSCRNQASVSLECRLSAGCLAIGNPIGAVGKSLGEAVRLVFDVDVLVFARWCRENGRMPSDSSHVTKPVQSSHLAAAAPPQVLLFQLFCPTKGIVTEDGKQIGPGITTIGRKPSGGTVIPVADDGGLSREHVTLTVDADQQSITLRDKSSKNSTWVNGLRVSREEERKLFHGDVLRLGDSVFVLSVTPSFDEQPTNVEQKDNVADGQAQIASTPKDAAQPPAASEILGRSPLIARLRMQIRRLALAKQSVLLLGERGTGKERAAAEFHSYRDGTGPLVPIDCGALQSELAASELFGHTKGAFTGAVGDKKGAILAAHKGTLFLDEIGNLSLENQEKLLRALESRSIQAVGSLGKTGTSVDVVLVSATSKDLLAETRNGRFKPDLFDRIAATTLTVPPLRYRREDILFLLQHARGPGNSETPQLPRLNTSQIELLLLYAWPGNVRELINIRGDLCAQGFHEGLQKQLLRTTYFQSPDRPSLDTSATEVKTERIAGTSPPESKPIKKTKLTVEALSALLIKHDGKLLPIAKETGWDPHTLRDWVAKYDLHHLRKKDG